MMRQRRGRVRRKGGKMRANAPLQLGPVPKPDIPSGRKGRFPPARCCQAGQEAPTKAGIYHFKSPRLEARSRHAALRQG